MESFRNIECPRNSLAGFFGSFVDLYYEIDSFYQGEVHFNITSKVNCTSEEYVEKEIILVAIDGYDDNDDDDDDDDDDDGEFLPGAISSSDYSEEENDEEIENNFSVVFM